MPSPLHAAKRSQSGLQILGSIPSETQVAALQCSRFKRKAKVGASISTSTPTAIHSWYCNIRDVCVNRSKGGASISSVAHYQNHEGRGFNVRDPHAKPNLALQFLSRIHTCNQHLSWLRSFNFRDPSIPKLKSGLRFQLSRPQTKFELYCPRSSTKPKWCLRYI